MRIFIFTAVLLISLAGLLSPIPPPPLFSHIDTFLHCMGFLVLSLTTRLTFRRAPGWLIWGALLVFAPVSEWLQHIVQPTLRSFNRMDIVANLAGIVLAVLIWLFFSFCHQRWQLRKLRLANARIITTHIASTSASNSPNITLFALGGTISAHHPDRLELCDYRTGHYSPADFLAAIPELTDLANINLVQLDNVTSTAIDTHHWFELKERIEQCLLEQDAVIITQGTNTLEETAFFLHLTLNTTKPVIITGAQKPLSALGTDAHFNLLNSFRVAACPQAAGQGVLVVMNDKIYSAQDVTKTHTYHLESFQAPNSGPLGRIEANHQVHFIHSSRLPHTTNSPFCTINKPKKTPYIPIIYSHAGADQQLLEALLEHTQLDGLVVTGTGAGRCSPLEEQTLYKIRTQGIPVVMTSRVGAGGVVPIEHYQNLGLITLGDLSPQKARIWLLLHLLKQA